MRARPAGRRALALLTALLVAGCGYAWRGTLPEHLRTIAVPPFANRTSEPGAETLVTRAVIEAFTTSGRLQVVPPERADALLQGEVTGYEVQSIAFDPRANVRLYRLVITVNLRLFDRLHDRVLFERFGHREQADFRVAGAVSETIAREAGALRAAATDVGRAIVALTLDRF
ncbi:MAG TPA: LptE family protein [Candidatus Binatia bacterium]|nr:LptE family protein [Candidatus Binatia bacterium]